MGAGPHAISQIHGFAIPGSAKQPAYSVLQVETRSGVTGYGECRPLSHADMEALNRLVGKPAHAYEALTPMAPESARGGLNMALLDIVGKITNAPVYRVLGGLRVSKLGPSSGLQDRQTVSSSRTCNVRWPPESVPS